MTPENTDTIRRRESAMRTVGSPRTEGTTGSAATMGVTGSVSSPRATGSTEAIESSSNAATDQEPETSCTICCDMPRDTLLMPCCHIAVCSVCSLRVRRCLICKGHVESTIQVGFLNFIVCYLCLSLFQRNINSFKPFSSKKKVVGRKPGDRE